MASETMQKAPRRYEKMRDSGVEWIGMVPSHWEIVRARAHFMQTNERGNQTPVLLAASQKFGVCPQDQLEGVVKVSVGTDLQQFKSVHRNDFIISLRSFQGGFELSPFEGVCSPAYQVFHTDDAYDVKYLRFLFKDERFIDHMNSLTVGIRDGKNIKYSDFSNSLIILPPLDEQIAIAKYLSQVSAKIDTLIGEIKASIEEYKAWKASIIYEAVTKGLDPNAEMKDSGVEWIGEIPAHWAFRKMKQVAQFAPKCDFSRLENDALITFAPMECIRNGYFENRGKQLNTITGSYTPYSEGDIVFAKVTPCFENGNICIMKNLYSVVGLGSSELFVLRARSISTEYLFYYLQHPGFVQRACASMTGTGGLKRVSSDFIQNCPLPIPTEEEQGEIVDFLNRRCTAIEQLISEKSALIEELESYKRSLIYEVVTGKRRVC